MPCVILWTNYSWNCQYLFSRNNSWLTMICATTCRLIYCLHKGIYNNCKCYVYTLSCLIEPMYIIWYPLFFFHFLLQGSVCSYILKAFISTSTMVLLVLIVLYHAREIQVGSFWLSQKKMIIFKLTLFSQQSIGVVEGTSNRPETTNWQVKKRQLWNVKLSRRRCSSFCPPLFACKVN